MNIISRIKNIWEYNRWELFLVCSILVLFICYFFKQEEYKGLSKNLYTLDSKNKREKSRGKKYENECRRIVESIFRDSFKTVRPDFLKNPKTGKNLELDMYNEKLKLAFEYQGAQHRVYTPFFHKSYDDFLKQLERDRYKKETCKENGIDLICIPDTILYEDLEVYIIKKLKEINKV